MGLLLCKVPTLFGWQFCHHHFPKSFDHLLFVVVVLGTPWVCGIGLLLFVVTLEGFGAEPADPVRMPVRTFVVGFGVDFALTTWCIPSFLTSTSPSVGLEELPRPTLVSSDLLRRWAVHSSL